MLQAPSSVIPDPVNFGVHPEERLRHFEIGTKYIVDVTWITVFTGLRVSIRRISRVGGLPLRKDAIGEYITSVIPNAVHFWVLC